MTRSPVTSVIVLAIGVALLVWGINAYNSASSNLSEAFQGAPSNKAIILLAAGGLASIIGLIGLLRPRRA